MGSSKTTARSSILRKIEFEGVCLFFLAAISFLESPLVLLGRIYAIQPETLGESTALLSDSSLLLPLETIDGKME